MLIDSFYFYKVVHGMANILCLVFHMYMYGCCIKLQVEGKGDPLISLSI